MSSALNNNKKTNRYSRMIKFVGIPLIVLAGSGALFNRMQASPADAKDLDDFLAQVQAKGGSLVRCEKNACRDLKTQTYLGNADDGMYVSYPEGAVSELELKREAETVKKLMYDAEQKRQSKN